MGRAAVPQSCATGKYRNLRRTCTLVSQFYARGQSFLWGLDRSNRNISPIADNLSNLKLLHHLHRDSNSLMMLSHDCISMRKDKYHLSPSYPSRLPEHLYSHVSRFHVSCLRISYEPCCERRWIPRSTPYLLQAAAAATRQAD